jgi:hypothetical protein
VSALPISQLDTATISTPQGLHYVTVALTHGADRLHTFDIEVGYGPDDVAALTMQLHTLSTALTNPGALINAGRVTVMADFVHDDVALYIPMASDYAVLHLTMDVVIAFVSAAQADVSAKRSTALDVQMSTEHVIDTVAEEGFHALDAWLATQG